MNWSLPMGCTISCACFEAFSTFMEWVVRQEWFTLAGALILLCVGASGSESCLPLLRTLCSVFEQFCVPLAHEKMEGLKEIITFLGILVDSILMEWRLPAEKLMQEHNTCMNWKSFCKPKR